MGRCNRLGGVRGRYIHNTWRQENKWNAEDFVKLSWAQHFTNYAGCKCHPPPPISLFRDHCECHVLFRMRFLNSFPSHSPNTNVGSLTSISICWFYNLVRKRDSFSSPHGCLMRQHNDARIPDTDLCCTSACHHPIYIFVQLDGFGTVVLVWLNFYLCEFTASKSHSGTGAVAKQLLDCMICFN